MGPTSVDIMVDDNPKISLHEAFAGLEFLPDRIPGDDRAAAAAGGAAWYDRLAAYRDGSVFIVHYAGDSEWERHPAGDEVVMVIEGRSTMTLFQDDRERQITLEPMEMVIVPQGVWHRFHTPDGAKIMTVTPLPTDHTLDHPAG